MGYYAFNPAKIVSGAPIIYDESGNVLFQWSKTGANVFAKGGDTTGDGLLIYANSVNDYPRVKWNGGAGFDVALATGAYWKVYNQTSSIMRFNHAAGITNIEGSITTAHGLLVKATQADTYPTIKLIGDGGIEYRARTPYHVFYDQATEILTIRLSSTHASIEGATDLDIYLKPTGTGKVRFGTYNAKGAEAFTGYITINDAAGNARKVMVCA